MINMPTPSAQYIAAFIKFASIQFYRHGGMQHAGALTYTSLLSLVPLMTVMLAIFSAFPLADQLSKTIEDFVFSNFVPASGEVMQDYLGEFSAKASNLSGMGMAFLLVVALMMMSSIDRVLNQIWEVKTKRNALSKFLMYWAVLSLGPLLIGGSVLITSYLVSLPLLSDAAASGLGRKLLGLTPMAASCLAFVLMYMVIPNRRVYFKHALIGGFTAAVMFELAKRGFALYVTTFPTYQAIYGALATIPIFLVWVFLSWVIVLAGAELTHCIAIYHWDSDNKNRAELSLLDVVALLVVLGKSASKNKPLKLGALCAHYDAWREYHIETLLYELKAHGLVHKTQENYWILAKPLSEISLNDVYRCQLFHLPQKNDSPWLHNDTLLNVFDQANHQLLGELDAPLSHFKPQ